ncbi:hypothetical protein LRS10_21570 [Phenylobacterium sp. J426]|uniref:hypothetical protein n=1 Tax=Phenylobacterium sp. J426 TaxID=2898439 RepID=UPI002150923E|nr:hypothetical protein [Phenylobacterium sp. J426]MCR5876503.1 hypothetical protein [Phenylobacterium sp. J426]
MTAGVLLLTLAIAACAEGQDRRARASAAAEGLCKAFDGPRSTAPDAADLDGGLALDDCLHRWGYTLAKSEDDAPAVAGAVVAACSAPLARWNQQALNAAAGAGQALEAPSLLTGEPTNPIAEHGVFAQGRALFYVVQARAGDCEPPRVDSDTRDRARQRAAPATNSPDP